MIKDALIPKRRPRPCGTAEHFSSYHHKCSKSHCFFQVSKNPEAPCVRIAAQIPGNPPKDQFAGINIAKKRADLLPICHSQGSTCKSSCETCLSVNPVERHINDVCVTSACAIRSFVCVCVSNPLPRTGSRVEVKLLSNGAAR